MSRGCLLKFSLRLWAGSGTAHAKDPNVRDDERGREQERMARPSEEGHAGRYGWRTEHAGGWEQAAPRRLFPPVRLRPVVQPANKRERE